MSIIYDALKKVENSHKKAREKEQTDKPAAVKPEEEHNKPKGYLLYALIICFGFLIAGAIYEWLLPKDIANIPRPRIKQSAEYNLQPVKSGMLKETFPSFTLNGVFFSGDEGYALVNNRIVKEGDKIDGATVAKISMEEVELEFGVSVIRLYNNIPAKTD